MKILSCHFDLNSLCSLPFEIERWVMNRYCSQIASTITVLVYKNVDLWLRFDIMWNMIFVMHWKVRHGLQDFNAIVHGLGLMFWSVMKVLVTQCFSSLLMQLHHTPSVPPKQACNSSFALCVHLLAILTEGIAGFSFGLLLKGSEPDNIQV